MLDSTNIHRGAEQKNMGMSSYRIAHHRMTMWLIAGAMAFSVAALVQSDLWAASPANASDEFSQPLYSPPKTFTPRARVGGAMRGTDGKDPEVQALVPDHVALTTKKTPLLSWYLSKSTTYDIVFTLVDTRYIKPVHEGPISVPKTEGIHSIDLKSLGLSLEPEVQYRWYISVIRDANSHAPDIVAGGMIERCEFSACVTEMNPVLTCASPDDVMKNARAGLWYDAMGCLCNLIDSNPKDAKLRRLRARLLKDVGLAAVAEWDLRSIETAR